MYIEQLTETLKTYMQIDFSDADANPNIRETQLEAILTNDLNLTYNERKALELELQIIRARKSWKKSPRKNHHEIRKIQNIMREIILKYMNRTEKHYTDTQVNNIILDLTILEHAKLANK